MSDAEPDALEKFMTWWSHNRVIGVPFDAPVMNDIDIWGVVLYRRGPWQVQLFILKPFAIVPDHRHPNVDSFEVYLSGDIQFSLEGEVLSPPVDAPDFDGLHPYKFTKIRVLPSAWHGAKTGKQGGAFLSFQRWLNGAAPTNVGDDWIPRTENDARRRYPQAEGGAP